MNNPTKIKAKQHVTISPQVSPNLCFVYPVLISAYLQLQSFFVCSALSLSVTDTAAAR